MGNKWVLIYDVARDSHDISALTLLGSLRRFNVLG